MKITAGHRDLTDGRVRERHLVRLHTDSGVIGLGETFYGAGAVEAHIHDTLAGRLLGRNPLHIEAIHREMLNLPMVQSSTGAEYRSASAIDIALWDVFGKVCNQPVHQMLGGLCRPKQRIYNTFASYEYVGRRISSPCRTGTAAKLGALMKTLIGS